jgi:predicted acyltransferase
MNGDGTNGNRIASIDIYRGVAILVMILGNFLIGVSWIPAWLKHAPDIGFTGADIIAPVFIFSIGLNYANSFQRKAEQEGLAMAYGETAKRYAAILGMGAFISYGQAMIYFGQPVLWGVLQSIGIAGMLCLFTVRLGAVRRILVGLCVLAVYQLLLDTVMLRFVLGQLHGGMIGSVSWGAMLMISTGLAEIAVKGEYRISFAVGAGFMAAGALFNIITPISKNRVSAPYILLVTGICLIAYLIFRYLFDDRGWRIPALASIGRNPISLYMMHFLLLAIVVLPPAEWWYVNASWWLIMIQISIIAAAVILAAEWLDKRKIYISI